VSDAVTSHSAVPPSICLNMIVRNEAHIVHEVLDAVAPYISYWVVVDTGSDDGTPDVIRNHMAGLGIPGQLHERPWRDFAHNRTEAFDLAQGHGDYIWVMDADDTVVGKPDFSRLDADIYTLRIGEADDDSFFNYRRPLLFRDGTEIRYRGVIHEYPAWSGSYVVKHLDGDYYVESRHLGGRNLDPHSSERDRDMLLAEVERNPDDARSVFYLAQTYFVLGDFANALEWYARRVEMGGYLEEVYYAKYRVAQSMAKLGAAWPDVQYAYLQAWAFRPIRSEPLYFIARSYRDSQRYELGYAFAKRAAEIPLPTEPTIQLRADIYAWRATDELAVCASWTNRYVEAFRLSRKLLAANVIPKDDRRRIAANRDLCVPVMVEAAAPYPHAVVERLAEPGDLDVTISLLADNDLPALEQTINSFLNCCLDVARRRRFVLFHTDLSAKDQATLHERYPFLEIRRSARDIRDEIDTRFWLHLGQGWRFFAPENLITRLTAILDTEPDIFQVGINYTDATHLTGTCAPDTAIRHAPDTGRYTLTDHTTTGPAMFDTTRLNQPGLHTATLDEVLCTVAT